MYILLTVYILAVNFYAFLLIKNAQAEDELTNIDAEADADANANAYGGNGSCNRYNGRNGGSICSSGSGGSGNVGNGKLLLTALLGGAIAVYVCMFVFRFRLNNLLLMVAMPVLAALNVYLFFIAYRSGFGLFVV
jgi:hypothetical protein